MRSKKPCSAAKSVLAIFLMSLLALAIAAQPAQAQTFKVLHTFHGKDGANPSGQFLWDKDGNLISITVNGGTGDCSPHAGCGTVFDMNTSGKIVWSYSLKNFSEGFEPDEGLYQDAAGNLYGTTNFGGIVCDEGYTLGCGIVFKLDTALKETVLHRFRGPFNGYHDGYYGEGFLVADQAANLYGSTEYGGTGDNGGIVFRISPAGKETIVYNFPGPPCGPEGGGPASPLILRPGDKRLYGGACGGGTYGQGTAFRMTTSGELTVLYDFTGGGGPSNSGLFTPYGGSLYGASGYGGNGNCGTGGCGTVFELSPNGGSWTEKTLYVFCQVGACKDGEFPDSTLVIDSAGNIYGTTDFGGDDPQCYNGGSCGVVYKLDPSGNETVLHSFSGSDGAFPVGVVMDSKGNLYGATGQGGDLKCLGSNGHGCGVVFEITP
jgi:uncharacterized repeat protein (TIGR03803 family)